MKLETRTSGAPTSSRLWRRYFLDFEKVKVYHQAMNPTSVIPVFHVKDVDASVRFYTAILDFAQAFRYGTYVGLRLGKCELHICPPGDYGSRVGGGNA